MGKDTKHVDAHLDRSPLHLLHRAVQAADAIFAEHGHEFGLTSRQFAVLVVVNENNNLNQTQIVERTGLDRSTLSDVIRRLTRKGLLRCRRDIIDARAVVVQLTDKGRQVLREVEPAAALADAATAAALPEARRSELLQLLTTIITTLAAKQAPAPITKRG